MLSIKLKQMYDIQSCKLLTVLLFFREMQSMKIKKF